MAHWVEVSRKNPLARRMASRHYSYLRRGPPRNSEVGPPGQKIILLTADGKALWGSHRPAPWAGIPRADRFEGWCCFIFRNEGYPLAKSSELIREAVAITVARWGPAAILTYVGVEKVRSPNPGYCFIVAGFEPAGYLHSPKLGKLRRLVMPEQLAAQLAREAPEPALLGWRSHAPQA